MLTTLGELQGIPRYVVDHPELPIINEFGHRRCPEVGCGEYVNKQCWRCGWLRPPGDSDLVKGA